MPRVRDAEAGALDLVRLEILYLAEAEALVRVGPAGGPAGVRLADPAPLRASSSSAGRPTQAGLPAEIGPAAAWPRGA